MNQRDHVYIGATGSLSRMTCWMTCYRHNIIRALLS